ncbi:hypothetical protein [Novosphingobium sp. TH158]|uniref:hypothetical protein n=1 Tax=Novosphingobium sp. TH158 TaxID=2067455 RepID=UPI0013044471|nr:hypothetical protein [Novosphingobium sp. TH158]
MRVAVAVCLLLIAGCRRAPSFDEQYAAVEKAINSEAAAIDRELASSVPEAAQSPPTD